MPSGFQPLEVVSGQIYRGPQPVGEDWKVLEALGICGVLKLNYADEGNDQGALDLDMAVMDCAMPPRDFIGSFGKPDPAAIAEALAILRDDKWTPRPIYVHCTHGQDRTGLVIGEYRVLHQGWATWRAFEEMLKYGFHPELPDLMMTWLEFALEQEERALHP